MPSLFFTREQLLVAKHNAKDKMVVLPLEVAENLHVALSGFARLRERTRELRRDVKDYMLKNEQRVRELRSKNHKLLTQLADARSAGEPCALCSSRAETRSPLRPAPDGPPRAAKDSPVLQRVQALESKLRQQSADEDAAEEAGPVLERLAGFRRRLAGILKGGSTMRQLATQSAVLAAEMQLLQRQLAEVEVQRARVDAELDSRHAEDPQNGSPLITRSSTTTSLSGTLTPRKPAQPPLGVDDTLTMMLVDAKVQLAEAQDEVTRTRRALKRVTAEKEATEDRIAGLTSAHEAALERAREAESRIADAEARVADAEEASRLTRAALKHYELATDPHERADVFCCTLPLECGTGIYLQQDFDIAAHPSFAAACRRLSPVTPSSLCDEDEAADDERNGATCDAEEAQVGSFEEGQADSSDEGGGADSVEGGKADDAPSTAEKASEPAATASAPLSGFSMLAARTQELFLSLQSLTAAAPQEVSGGLTQPPSHEVAV